MAQVGLLFVLLDVIAVGLGIDLPIDAAEFVAGVIGPVLGKFDREAVVGALVQPP